MTRRHDLGGGGGESGGEGSVGGGAGGSGVDGWRSLHVAPPRHCVVAIEPPLASPSTTMAAVLEVLPVQSRHSIVLYVAPPSNEYWIEPAQASVDGLVTRTPIARLLL